ncbi:hypothetical protein EXU34_23615, partial [Alteromonas sp. ZYF713]|nr:hypothetical protein [Alteromonas sp. ZYF713]
MATKVMMFLCVVVTCMVLAAPYVEAITCGQVTSKLAPCVGYLQKGGVVPPSCCSGVKALNSAAKTTPDRQATCNCIKSASSSISGINPSQTVDAKSQWFFVLRKDTGAQAPEEGRPTNVK